MNHNGMYEMMILSFVWNIWTVELLQVRGRDGTWFEAKPLEGGVLLLADDMLEHWTAGRIEACVSWDSSARVTNLFSKFIL